MADQTQTPTAAPTNTPAPSASTPSGAAPLGPPPGTWSIDDLAQKVKEKYPVYASMDNRTLTQKVINKYPVYQTKLSQDAIQELAGPQLRNDTSYLSGRKFGMEVAKGMGLDAERIKAAEDRYGQVAAIHEIGTQVLHGLKGLMYDPLMPVTGTASQFEQAVRSGSPGQIVGALAGILGGAEAPEGARIPGRAVETARTVAKAPGEAREAVGARIHTPEGELTPGAQRASEVAGGGMGFAAGHAVGGPIGGGIGAAAGARLGPSLVERIFPEPKTLTQMREQAARYQQLADDLMQRGKEQEALDRKAAAEQLRTERAETRARAATTSKTVLGPEAPPPRGALEGMQGTTPGEVAGLPTRDLPRGSASPFEGAVSTRPEAPAPTFVSKFEKPGKGRIVSPESEAPQTRVTYQSILQKDLLPLVRTGDRLAIQEWQRRGLPLPENVRYMIEQGETKGYPALHR
jgi:hypothetical protein